MDTRELEQRGIAVRKEVFGNEAVEKRMNALGEFGAPLQNLINTYAYGEVWARPGLPKKMRSLVVIGMNAAINRPAEFKVHVNGAINNGCTPDEIREVCLLVALYAGIPASNDAHRIALEVFTERGIK
ncbi:MAG: carboxymuconolactone decarboxylase family protein [Terriglobia bacterium]